MRIHVINVSAGKQEFTIWLPPKKPVTVEIDETTKRLKSPASMKYRLTFVRHGQNVIVTDFGVPYSVSIHDQPLQLNTAHTWLEGQTLRLGDLYLLSLEPEPKPSRNAVVGRVITAILIVLLLASIFLVPWLVFRSGGISVDDPTVTATAAQVSTATATPVPGPSPTLQSISRAIPTEVRLDPLDTAQRAVVSTTATVPVDISATPIPCILSSPQAAEWDPDITVQVEPACARPGESYWRLVRTQWLDDVQYDGYHHLFVDVVDEDENRIYGASFVMSWQDGQCRRFIRGLTEPLDHGEHCPMFASGPAYELAVEGLPSEMVRGLGLGAVDPIERERRYLTSYYLLFQRATLSEE